MAPTTTPEHQFLGATTTPKGVTTIQFEGCEPRRTTKAQQFLVGYISHYCRRYVKATGEYVPTLPTFEIVQGTAQEYVARRAAHKLGRGAIVLRKTETGYQVHTL